VISLFDEKYEIRDGTKVPVPEQWDRGAAL